jgi:hypothetical protein
MDAFAVDATRTNLQRENFFMKRRLEDIRALNSNILRAPSHTPQECRQGRPKESQYKRYFAEREEWERIAIARNTTTSQKIDDEVQSILNTIEGLSQINQLLRAHLNSEDGGVP